LVNLVEEWREAMDKDNVASWGMSKAFDMVDHTILLVEVGKYGVIGKELKWFDGYLSGGRQIVLHRRGKKQVDYMRLREEFCKNQF